MQLWVSAWPAPSARCNRRPRGMTTLTDTLQQWAAQSRERIGRLPLEPRLERIGRVVQAGDGVITVAGLPDTRLDELLEIEGGGIAQAVDLGEDTIGCVLLGE